MILGTLDGMLRVVGPGLPSRMPPHEVQNLPVAFPMIVSSSSESPDSSRPRRHVFTCQKPGIDDDVVKTIVGTTYPFGCN